MGDIVLELNAEKAPITVENFLSYVNKKHYDGTVFHRVIDGFMIQGGFAVTDGKLVEKASGKGIKNESQNGLKNERGTIAMARTNDPDSATAQFFINVVDNAMLNYPSNGGYAVFGKVVEGMDVVDKIKAVKTGVSQLRCATRQRRGTRNVSGRARRGDHLRHHRVSVVSGSHHSS
jgi:peptidyl-prolyl cis-trans isomerase A (cyclophilin A)